MGTMIDGVSKLFVVRHEYNAMHFDGHKIPADAALACLRINWNGDYDYVARLIAFRACIDAELAREAAEAARPPEDPDGDETRDADSAGV